MRVSFMALACDSKILSVACDHSRHLSGRNIFVLPGESCKASGRSPKHRRCISSSGRYPLPINAQEKLIDEPRADFEAHTRNKLYNAFVRVARCATRAPERLRQSLEQAVIPIVREDPIDLEVIEATLDATASAFLEQCEEESAKTALKALGVTDVDGFRHVGAKVDFSGIDVARQREVEAALSNLKKLPGSQLKASNVFETMALALDAAGIQSDEIATLIVDYVAGVASRWREAGIKPSRARHPGDLKYKSSFHKFVELVITAILEPWTLRHDDGLEERAQAIWRRHAELPHDFRSIASPSLRRSDVEWIVSDDHLRKALARAA